MKAEELVRKIAVRPCPNYDPACDLRGVCLNPQCSRYAIDHAEAKLAVAESETSDSGGGEMKELWPAVLLFCAMGNAVLLGFLIGRQRRHDKRKRGSK